MGRDKEMIDTKQISFYIDIAILQWGLVSPGISLVAGNKEMTGLFGNGAEFG